MPALVGSKTPRLFTPPLRRLTRRTSLGFEVIDFAHLVLGIALLPWQQWLLVHALELLPDGSFRFRVVVVLVARQNGKTTVLKVLSLWRLLLDGARLVFGTSVNLDYAHEAWEGAVELARESPGTLPEFRWPERRTNGQQTLTTTTGGRYKIGTATRRGGRSLSVDLGIADELREHQTWDAWAALSGTTTARPNPQLWALSNAGDDLSAVLNHFRDAGVAAIDAGELDADMMLAEWSAPEGCELDDRRGWVAANPGLGHTITERTLTGKLKLPPAVFRTEHLCQRVMTLNSAIDLAAWSADYDRGTLDHVRDRVAVCLDVAPDLAHATLAAAAVLDDGRARVAIVDAWRTVDEARRALPGLLARVKPRTLGWFPNGPGAALVTELREANRRRDGKTIPRRIAGATVVEFGGADVPVICQSFAEQVAGGRILHAGDPLLTAQVSGASKLYQGDGWRFARRDVGHVDAVYAAAGAVYLARTLPPPLGRPRVVTATTAAA